MKTTHKPTKRLYQNCRIYNVENKLIFTCSIKRAQWYLDRNLAEIISEEPLSVKLLFECKGSGHSDDPYYLQDLINQCVVCGEKENLTHHHCVGYSYRKHFPNEIKEHSHHDVLLLCVPCHEKYETIAVDFKKELAIEYNAPIDGIRLNKEEFIENLHVKGAAVALLGRHKDKIPQERKDFLLNRIEKSLGKKVTEEDLKHLIKMRPKPHILTHAQLVVKQLSSYDLIDQFCARWRKHFVETMQPKFLPQFWDIYKKINPERSKIVKII